MHFAGTGMSLPKYPEYKDSGMAWVGAIPCGWGVQPLIGVAAERSESNEGMKEKNLLSLSYGRIVRRDIETNDGLLPESFETYQVVHPGDVVFRLTDLQNDKRSLRTAPVSEVGIITSAYLAVMPRKIDSAYFAYLMRSYDLTKVFYSMGGGLRQSMKYSDVKRLPVIVPPRDDQVAIATFLNRETAKIDALISEQEKLLTLLAEKRQATISHAVTRGLDPTAPMKDSGIAWLGEVPAHWDVRRVSRSFKARKGSNAAELTKEFCATIEGDHPVFSGQTENEGVMGFIDRYEFDAGEDGWILSTTVGAKAMSVMHVKGRFSLSQNCMVILPIVGEIVTRFFFYHFQPLFSYERRMIPDHMQPSFRMEDFYDYKVGIPPADEQRAIASFLDGESAQLDNLKREVGRTIALLKERRSALIAAAVTGKIDVRGAAEAQAA